MDRLRSTATLGSLLTLLASVPAGANCTADSGSVEDITTPGVTVTCDDTTPNPYPRGIGSIATSADLSVTVESSAEVLSPRAGVTLAQGGSLSNDGSIIAVDEAVVSTATSATARATITNSGRLESTNGVAVSSGAGRVDVTNSGTILGAAGGVTMTGGSLDNSGTLEATDALALAVTAGASTAIANSGRIASSGSGVALGANGTLDNSGELVSRSGFGVSAAGGAAITNTGTIQSTGGDGVTLAEGATLDNSGSVSAANAAAVTLANGASLSNSGTLSSSTGPAVVTTGGATIDNDGRIEGSAGTAIQLTGDGNTLTLAGGSSLSGSAVAVSSGAATDALVLTGSGSEDDDFVNFATLTLRGGNWSLGGAVEARAVSIESGTLTVNGLLDTRDAGGTAATITLGAGTLAGNGTVQASIDNVAGTVSAGAPTGTLTIAGDYRQAATATMRVSGSAGDVSRLQVDGSADLAGTLVVSAGADVVADILTASGGITGFYDAVEVDGRALVAVVPSADSIRLVRASTTLEDNMVEANLDNTYLLLDSLAPPLRDAGSGAWARGVGYYGNRGSSDGLPGGDYWIGGALVGADWRVAERWRLGAAVGYTTTDLDSDDHSSGDADSWNYGAYVLYDAESFWASLTLAGAQGSYDQHREIVVNGARESVPADYDSAAWAVRGSLGLRADFLDNLAGRWVFEPLVSVDYVVTDLDDYSDKGGAGLDYHIGDIESLQLSGLLRVRELPTAGSVAPRLHAGIVYRKALDDREWRADNPAGGLSVVLPGNDDDETFGVAAAGFEARFGGRTSLSADLVGQWSSDKTTYGLIAGVRLAL